MTEYIHHTSNTIDVAPRSLPSSWGNTSGLNHADAAELKSLGWLPVIDQIPPGFNEETQTLVHVSGAKKGDAVPVDADSVTRVYEVKNKPTPNPVPAILERREVMQKEELIKLLPTYFTDDQAVILQNIIKLIG